MQASAQTQSSTGRFWAFVPVILLGSMLSGLGLMAVIASRDPGFALEPNYYQKALAWDAHQAQEAKNRDLGWALEPTDFTIDAHSRSLSLAVRVTDAAKKPVSGAQVHVSAFPNARATHLHEADLTEREPGVYQAPLSSTESGIWELRFSITQGAQRFTAILRPEARSRSPQ